MNRPLLESESWIVTGNLRCKCPRCGAELSSNAFARKKHKDRCEGWKRTETLSPAEKKVTPAVQVERLHQAWRATDDAVRSSNPTPPPAPRLPWIEYRNGPWTEWDVTFGTGPSRIYLRVREMSACIGGNRYSSYAGKTYIGSFSTLEIAQGSAERLVGVEK